VGAGEAEGVVEEVGFRSTRIRTFHNSLISVPNGKVAVSTVDNLGKRRVRRVKATLGLTYDTPPARLRAFVEALRARLRAHPAVAQAPLEVHFSGFGDSALEVMVYFFLDVPSWSEELDTRAALFMGFLDDAEAAGVRFAFPSRSLYLETPVALKPGGPAPGAPPGPAAC
jgi:MscS family membrane protein